MKQLTQVSQRFLVLRHPHWFLCLGGSGTAGAVTCWFFSCDDQVLPLGTDFTRFSINIEGRRTFKEPQEHFAFVGFPLESIENMLTLCPDDWCFLFLCLPLRHLKSGPCAWMCHFVLNFAIFVVKFCGMSWYRQRNWNMGLNGTGR